MLKIPLREVPLRQKNQLIIDNTECRGFKGSKMNSYFKTIRHSIHPDKSYNFLSLRQHQNHEPSLFYPRHRKSATQQHQNYESNSLKCLHSFYASQQKNKQEQTHRNEQRKLLSKIMIAFRNPERQKTKKEQQFLLARHQLKRPSFNDSLFSQRQNKIQKRMFYYAGQRHKQILSKLSSERRAKLTSQIAQALVVKKYRNKQTKSCSISK